jgi:hypothetical protein
VKPRKHRVHGKGIQAREATYWRTRAEEARVVAESMQDEQSKQLMLGVAKDYERVAELTEKRLKSR